jgi:hypothetical protein
MSADRPLPPECIELDYIKTDPNKVLNFGYQVMYLTDGNERIALDRSQERFAQKSNIPYKRTTKDPKTRLEKLCHYLKMLGEQS